MKSSSSVGLEDPPRVFGSLAELPEGNLLAGRFRVLLNGGRFECFLQPQQGPYLFVLLSGARNPERMRLPVFDRWSWAESFPGPVINISDPTLYLAEEHLRIGWYVGTADADWTASLAALIEKVAERLDVPLGRTVVYGSSAGGFASLMIATRLEGIISVAINPQTEILNYSRRHVDAFLDRAYGKPREELEEADLGRLSVVRSAARLRPARGILVQNKLDLHHFEKHHRPLCRRLGLKQEGSSTAGFFQSMTYSSETGHGPEPREMLPMILDAALGEAALAR